MTEKYVIQNITRPEPEMIEAMSALDVSTVYEAQGKIGLLGHHLKSVSQGNKVCGPAVTAVCYAGDNLMIHAAIEVCKPGDVLVITTIGDCFSGMIGELLVSALIKRGVQGVIIDAGIRDASQIRELGFPVWSKSIYSEGTTKSRGGWVNAPAVCGNTTIHPGDLIMADDDGVVVVRKENLASALNASKQRLAKEDGTKQKIERGELSLDFYGLRETLKQQNVIYYEDEERFARRDR